MVHLLAVACRTRGKEKAGGGTAGDVTPSPLNETACPDVKYNVWTFLIRRGEVRSSKSNVLMFVRSSDCH